MNFIQFMITRWSLQVQYFSKFIISSWTLYDFLLSIQTNTNLIKYFQLTYLPPSLNLPITGEAHTSILVSTRQWLRHTRLWVPSTLGASVAGVSISTWASKHHQFAHGKLMLQGHMLTGNKCSRIIGKEWKE